MKKVFAVTSGEYSDYGVDAMFSTKELAEAYVNSPHGSYSRDFTIEEWDIDVPPEDYLPQPHTLVDMRRDGTTNCVRTDMESKNSGRGEEGNSLYPVWFRRGSQDKDDMLMVWIWTADQKRAIKVANEKRTAILALNIWGNNEKVKELIK